MKEYLLFEDDLKKLIDAGLINIEGFISHTNFEEIYAEEIIDLFMLLSREQQSLAFMFFDRDYYLSQLTLPIADDANALEHFLLHGIRHNFAPHPLIQPAYMIANRRDIFSGTMNARIFVAALVADWCDPCPFIWSAWYRASAGVEAGQSALTHYFRHGAALNLAPNPYFVPDAYAAAAPDAPRSGMALVLHFLAHGDPKQVPAGDRFDPQWYVSHYPEARHAGIGPLQYFLSIGRNAGHKPRNEDETFAKRIKLSGPTSERAAPETAYLTLDRWHRFHKSIEEGVRARLEAFHEQPICPVSITDHVKALDEIKFAEENEAEVDVLIPCYNEFEITVECLAALQRAHSRRKLRIFVADDASSDERMLLLRKVPGLVVLRNSENLHFLRSCNRAFAATHAPYLFLLNNDTQVLDDAIDRLVDVLEHDPRVGAAVPMFLYPNGRLQEAGGTLRFDGESTMIGVGEAPERSCYLYRREVEYGSGAGLMLRREALDGRLFDEVFAPAYCEDADLCLRLRNDGWQVIYEPAARVIHHLSVSTNRASQRRRVQTVRKNQQKLFEKWGAKLRADNRARVLAFYLPQFHPIDRNNIWWGRGFTEWTNVTRAVPSFDGHYQPHLPSDLGFYDLRRVETMAEQQALANRYGIEGFVVYYYNFGAARVLEQPMETLLQRTDVDFRFAMCWANENWSRHWDGGARALLLEQQYDDATLDSVADDLARFASDPRCIRVDGKPLVLIYRPLLIPDVARVVRRMRDRFQASGHRAVHFVYVESMEAIEKKVMPADLGFDACVEFPPQGIAEPLSRVVTPVKAGWEGNLYDYAGTARNSVMRESVPYVRYPAVTPSWDNTARQPLKGTVLVGAEPELFQAYVERKLEELLNFTVGENRLLFVNAWNEWAEGAHLEPDRGYGHRWLAAVRNAMLAKGVSSWRS